MRSRTLTGICNDVTNPLMGAANMPFARNVQFEQTFPDQGLDPLTLEGRRIRVRGWIDSYNGPVISADHPQMIEVQPPS